jgi:hypothetical protein
MLDSKVILINVAAMLDIRVPSVSCPFEGVPDLEVEAVLAFDNHILLSDSPAVEVASRIQGIHLCQNPSLEVLASFEYLLTMFLHESGFG